MIRLIWSASVHIRYFMRRYMPTNVALDAIRTRRGLKWGLPAMLLTLPYFYAASFCLLTRATLVRWFDFEVGEDVSGIGSQSGRDDLLLAVEFDDRVPQGL